MISQRPATHADSEFQYRVYASTRAQELAMWGWPEPQQETFLRMQFRARSHSYAATFPGARTSVLLLDGRPSGYAVVHRTTREIRLVDIALLPECRNRGIGTRWITALIQEAAGALTPLRLSVAQGNPAANLYRRLGFVARSGSAMYLEMEYDTTQTR